MPYVRIQIKSVARREDLQRWEEHMCEEARCCNNFCLGIYAEHEMRAVHVVKDGEPDTIYLTTLCEDCIRDTSTHELLVKEKHLMFESRLNKTS